MQRKEEKNMSTLQEITAFDLYNKSHIIKVTNLKFRRAAYGFVLHPAKGLLVQKLNTSSKFVLIGGEIAPDESHQEAIIREGLEETGLEITVEQPINTESLSVYFWDNSSQQAFRQESWFYLAKTTDDKNPVCKDPEEIFCESVSFQQLSELKITAFQDFLHSIIKDVVQKNLIDISI